MKLKDCLWRWNFIWVVHLWFIRVVVFVFLQLLVNFVLRLDVLHVGDEDGADSDAGQDAHDRRQDKHQTNHHASEVNARHAVEDNENIGVGQVLEAVVDADWEHGH